MGIPPQPKATCDLDSNPVPFEQRCDKRVQHGRKLKLAMQSQLMCEAEQAFLLA
jgi:hypothetical protein